MDFSPPPPLANYFRGPGHFQAFLWEHMFNCLGPLTKHTSDNLAKVLVRVEFEEATYSTPDPNVWSTGDTLSEWIRLYHDLERLSKFARGINITSQKTDIL